MSSSSKTSSPTKPGCKSCSSKHVPVVKETEKNKIVSPKLSQEEEIDLNIRIDSCGGKLSFLPLKITKVPKDTPCVNEGDSVTTNFTITITRPTVGPTLCWFSHFTITNPTTTDAVFSLEAFLRRGKFDTSTSKYVFIDIQTHPVTEVQPSSAISNGIITLPAGETVTGTVCDCVDDLDCPVEGSKPSIFDVVFRATPTQSGGSIALESCECSLDVQLGPGDCIDDTCYYFTENPQDGCTVAVSLVSPDPISNSCNDLFVVQGNDPVKLVPVKPTTPATSFVPVRPPTLGDFSQVNTLLICPECFDDSNTIVLNAAVTCPDFSCGSKITNETALTRQVNVIPSARACDRISDSAEITPICKTPEVCCSVTADVSSICVCKTSKVTQQPSVSTCITHNVDYYFGCLDGVPVGFPESAQFANIGFVFCPSNVSPFQVTAYCDGVMTGGTTLPVADYCIDNLGSCPKNGSYTLADIQTLLCSTTNDDRQIAFRALLAQFFTAVFNIELQSNSVCRSDLLTLELQQTLCNAYRNIQNRLAESQCSLTDANIFPPTATPLINALNAFNTSIPAPMTVCNPAFIEYDIDPVVTPGKNVCFTFALINACDSEDQTYTYELYTSPEPLPTTGCTFTQIDPVFETKVAPGSAPPKGDITVCAETSCVSALAKKTCTTTVCIPFVNIPEEAQSLIVRITSSSGKLYSCCQTIPLPAGIPLCLGECLTTVCRSNGKTVDCGTCAPNQIVTVTEPIDSSDNPNAAADRSTLKDLLILLLRNCNTTVSREIIEEQIPGAVDLFLTLGLHYTLSLGINCEDCCGKCVTVQNTFTLLTGTTDCVLPPKTCIPGFYANEIKAVTYDVVQFPPCLPVIKKEVKKQDKVHVVKRFGKK